MKLPDKLAAKSLEFANEYAEELWEGLPPIGPSQLLQLTRKELTECDQETFIQGFYVGAMEVMAMAEKLAEALRNIAAEKCIPSFDEVLPKLERGKLISIVDTDTALAREALAEFEAWKSEK